MSFSIKTSRINQDLSNQNSLPELGTIKSVNTGLDTVNTTFIYTANSDDNTKHVHEQEQEYIENTYPPQKASILYYDQASQKWLFK